VEALLRTSPFFAAVLLLTNLLTALNLTRVYRSVFLGNPLPKTRRTPEVNWLMALPMVSLTVLVLLAPLLMQRLDPVPGLASFSWPVALAVVGSGLIGVTAGLAIPLDQFRSRVREEPMRTLQDLLAFDFYTERFYRRTVVAMVALLARMTDWLDRRVVNGLVDGLGRFSLQSAEGLKLSVSGQMQTYVLTVVVAIVLLFSTLSWLVRGAA
jgi:NAD(P)H-quinone oxidoreductase subunit 5